MGYYTTYTNIYSTTHVKYSKVLSIVAMITLVLSVTLVGCGKDTNETAAGQVLSETSKESSESAATEAESAVAAESESASTEQSTEAAEETNTAENALLEDRAFVDDIYNKLIADDYEAVLEILKDETLLEKVEPYKYKDYLDDSCVYRLVTSDGKIIGMVLPKDMSENVSRYVWHSENEKHDYGFHCTEYGDKELDYMYSKRQIPRLFKK